jgi:hypothetical protein
MGVDHGGADIAMAKEFLNGANVVTRFQEMCGEGMAVLISIVPMKGLQSPFIIVTIRFMENRAPSFAGYGATRAIT